MRNCIAIAHFQYAIIAVPRPLRGLGVDLHNTRTDAETDTYTVTISASCPTEPCARVARAFKIISVRLRHDAMQISHTNEWSKTHGNVHV